MAHRGVGTLHIRGSWISILLVGSLSNTPIPFRSRDAEEASPGRSICGSSSNIQDETIVASGDVILDNAGVSLTYPFRLISGTSLCGY